MITEDENILNIVKILRTRIEDKKDETELILLHQAKDLDNLVIAEELKFWENNDLMRVTVSIEKEVKEEDSEEEPLSHFKGRFNDDFLFQGLPLPTLNREEAVIISVKKEIDFRRLRKRVEDLGFTDILRM